MAMLSTTQTTKNRSNRLASELAIAAAATLAVLSMCVPDANADFDYPDFTDPAGLTMMGTATTLGGSMLIVNPTGLSQAGSVWRTQKEAVGTAFTTTFDFAVTDINGFGADGFAFVIQNESVNAMGAPGGALGYASNLTAPTVPGITNSLAIEFDLWNNNNNWSDFNSQHHISVQSAGLNPNNPSEAFSLGAFNLPNDLVDGDVHQVQITYASNMLEIYFDDFSLPILSVAVNLSTLLNLDSGNLAWVGLTAATGGAAHSEQHEIRSWSFAGQVPAPGVGMSLAAGGLLVGARRRRRA